ncbi:DUF6783 domain-containing protein [uncultured Robinsoniella sp.]
MPKRGVQMAGMNFQTGSAAHRIIGDLYVS